MGYIDFFISFYLVGCFRFRLVRSRRIQIRQNPLMPRNDSLNKLNRYVHRNQYKYGNKELLKKGQRIAVMVISSFGVECTKALAM